MKEKSTNIERNVNDSLPESVPYLVHEGSVARLERQIKRLWIALVIAILICGATNAFSIYEWTRYDCITTEYTQDGEGTNVIGTGNEVLYGTEIGHKSS